MPSALCLIQSQRQSSYNGLQQTPTPHLALIIWWHAIFITSFSPLPFHSLSCSNSSHLVLPGIHQIHTCLMVSGSIFQWQSSPRYFQGRVVSMRCLEIFILTELSSLLLRIPPNEIIQCANTYWQRYISSRIYLWILSRYRKSINVNIMSFFKYIMTPWYHKLLFIHWKLYRKTIFVPMRNIPNCYHFIKWLKYIWAKQIG